MSFGRSLGFRAGAVIALAAAISVSGSAFAGATIPELQLLVQIDSGPVLTYTPTGTDNFDGTFSYNGYYEGEGWHLDFTGVGDPDPFVNNTIGYTNTSSADQHLIFTVIMPSMAIPGGSLMGGSIGGSVTDSNFSGAASVTSASPNPVYTGLIDLVPAPGATLLDDPFSSPPVPFAGGTSTFGPDSFGLPGPSMPGPAVASSIGIRLEFILTAGDSVGITSFFIVNPVPAPGAVALLGLAGLMRRSRRRR